MNKPLVSVIIAVKNGERFLASAIYSVLEQDYQPFEIIVVDGQSVDNTAKIAQSFKPIRYILQTGKGIADAYNVGINAAMGEFIAFLSADDIWAPNKLSIQIDYLLQHPEIQYTIARVKFFLEDGYSMPRSFKPELLERDHIGRIMETLVVRKKLFDSVGKFNTKLSVSEDVDWFGRASDYNVPMSIIPKVLLYKRVHDSNISLTTPSYNHDLLSDLRQSVYRKRNFRILRE